MQFCANIAMLLTEWPFLNRSAAAAEAGFDAVEMWWPPVEMWWPPPDQLEHVRERADRADVRVVRFALDAGDGSAGDQGLLCIPGRESEFRRGAQHGMELADEVNCTMVNALAGRRADDADLAAQLAHGRGQMAWLADLAAVQGVTVLLEPNTDKAKPGFLITTIRDAVALLDAVDRPDTGLVFDTFHVQRSEGDLTMNLRENAFCISHVQLGDAPDRHEPGTGEIRFSYLAAQLLAQGYDGYARLEYHPSTNTLESLSWLPEQLRAGPITADDLEAIRW